MEAEPGDTEFRSCGRCGRIRRQRRGDRGWVCMSCGRFDADPRLPGWIVPVAWATAVVVMAAVVGLTALAVRVAGGG